MESPLNPLIIGFTLLLAFVVLTAVVGMFG